MTGQLFTVPAKLTDQQEYVYEYLGRGANNASNVGFMLHVRQGCERCLTGYSCQYATSRGRQVLKALRKKGLLKRDRHHVYRRADSTPVIAPDEPVDWGGY